MEDTWAGRDLPVLDATLGLLEYSYMVTVSDIAGRTGLELAEVARALDALGPAYVDFRKTETGGDPRFWYVLKATPEARRAVGQWPTPERLIARLADGLSLAADAEDDPDRKSLLTHTAGLLAGPLREVSVQVAAQVVGSAGAAGPGGPQPSPADPAS